VCDVDVLV